MDPVNKTRPCPICGKEDWCLVAADGKACICQRIQENSIKRCGEAGWLHKVNISKIKSKKRKRYPKINWDSLCKLYTSVYSKKFSLIGGGMYGSTHYIPIYNYNQTCVGLQRVFKDNNKRMVSGSKGGLFLPHVKANTISKEIILITEGASDTVTGIKLGWYTVGRTTCTHATNDIIKLGKEFNKTLCIIPDNDKPGLVSANLLIEQLIQNDINSVMLVPPYRGQDLSDWVDQVGKESIRESIINLIISK